MMADALNYTHIDSQHRLMKSKLFSLGRAKMVALITLFVVILATAMAYLIILLFADPHFQAAFVLKMAAFISVLITPLMAWPLVGRHIKLMEIERSLYFTASYNMLTGFLSRYAFFNHLDALHKLARRNHTPLTIASIDIDEFKKINDTYGHAAGDAVLKKLGSVISHIVRNSDIVGRVGGDEFVMVLPNTNLAQARHVAEHIRAIIANTLVVHADKQIQFSLSIGLSQVDAINPEHIDALLIASDNALYQAKQSGRNQVVIMESASHST